MVARSFCESRPRAPAALRARRRGRTRAPRPAHPARRARARPRRATASLVLDALHHRQLDLLQVARGVCASDASSLSSAWTSFTDDVVLQRAPLSRAMRASTTCDVRLDALELGAGVLEFAGARDPAGAQGVDVCGWSAASSADLRAGSSPRGASCCSRVSTACRSAGARSGRRGWLSRVLGSLGSVTEVRAGRGACPGCYWRIAKSQGSVRSSLTSTLTPGRAARSCCGRGVEPQPLARPVRDVDQRRARRRARPARGPRRRGGGAGRR